MKSAPLILLAEVTDYRLLSGPRTVARPRDCWNPTSTIPLHLARMSASVMLALRGNQHGHLQFYSWVWASGQHGGERLFSPHPGYCHILFLRDDGGYLHTVGDYPAYDLPIPCHWVPGIISNLRDAKDGSDLLERIATAVVKTGFENDVKVISRDYWADKDLEGLTSPFFMATLLDAFCRDFGSRFGRFAACMATANEFSGRCEAFRLAREADPAGVEAAFVTPALARCEAGEQSAIEFLRSKNWPLANFESCRPTTAANHRLVMRLYASAMDARFRTAACEDAATMPEARDIPECAISVKTAPSHRDP